MTLPKGQHVSWQCAVSLVGRRLNVTLEDGSVLVNVQLLRIEDHKRLVFADPLSSLPLRVELSGVRFLVVVWPYALQQEVS